MDYIKIPRSLIYKDRNDLKDFGVQAPGTMNYLLFLLLKQQALMGVSGAREVALRCYNNAYYVCTLILLEANDFPELRISDYVDKILEIEKDKGHVDEVCLASMAMACLLLARYDEKRYGSGSDIWNNISYRCTHYQWYHSSATAIFHKMISCDYHITKPLSYTDFAPRDIIEVIVNCSERDLQLYAEYICERLALLKDPRQRIYGADMAIARIKDYKNKLCKDTEYNPKEDCFKYVDNDYSTRNFNWEDNIRGYYQQSKEAIDYYTQHYPTKEEKDSKKETVESPQTPKTEVIHASIRELESKLTRQIDELKQKIDEKEKALQKALQIIEEYEKPVTELTAKQKIRMEFALQLLHNSGLKELKLNKDKTATLLSLLMGDIGHQICYNYLIHRDYKPQIQDEKTILTIDQFCLEMGIKAFLDTQNTRGHKS